MDISTTLVSNAQATQLMEPTQCPLYHPAILAEPTSMFGIAMSYLRCNAHFPKGLAVGFGVISTICIKFIKTIARRANFALNRRDIIDQRQQFSDVVPVRRRGMSHDRNAVSVGKQMMFRTWFSTVYRAGACFFAPPTARTVALSTAQRPKSIWSAFRRWASRISWIFRQRPQACQSRKRRQQVMPEPHPISWGSISHGIPDLSTKSMPDKQARAGNGLRPGYIFRLVLTGICGSMMFHNSSVTNGLAIMMPPCMKFFGQTDAITMPFC